MKKLLNFTKLFLIGFMVFGINFLCYAYIEKLITEINKIMIIVGTFAVLFLLPITIILNVFVGYCVIYRFESPLTSRK